ncbi:MAG TPA: hypothetical protein DDY78_15185 [Planctomycetales bacterium]|jgi:hypothetical protein|nr:hypothetical protein [Planctomycetales bacterium]
MKRGVWIGGLFLSFGAWAYQAAAQEVIWRPSARPAELLPPVRLVVLPDAGATIGKPRPATTTEPLAVSTPSGVIAASYHANPAPTPVPRVWPDGLDGLDAPTPVTTTAPPPGIFAVDRGVKPALFLGETIAVSPKPGRAAPSAAPLILAPVPITENSSGEEGMTTFERIESWQPKFYACGEYLLWRFKKDTTPPLISTSQPRDFGILGRPTTQVLFGGDGLSSGTHSGARFTAGFWLDDCEHKAVEISGFFLPGDERQFQANSAMFPVIARPFFSVNRNAETVQLTAFPGLSTGNANVSNASNLWGLEANLRCNLCCGSTGCKDCCDCGCGRDGGWTYRVDALGGVRYLNLREGLTITENVQNSPTAPPPVNSARAFVFDQFATRNQFYGGQVGLDTEFSRGPWSLNIRGKVAIGDTHQDLNINGSQNVTFANGTNRNFVGGLLAERSNIGSFHRDRFSVVPEVDLNVSYHLNDHVRVFAGYDFLYWSSVVRPGRQIDRTIDETLIPNFASGQAPAGQNRPMVLFHESDFWAQGLNLGLEFRF